MLGMPSSLDQQYLDELKLTGVLFGGGDLEQRYRVEAAHRGEWGPEVFLYLFKLYSSNTSGKTKKWYMSVRPGKHRKIFGLYEDSFHDFKSRYFKIFPVGDHRPFWLSLEGDGLFPPYWSDQAGFDVVPITYQRRNADQRDTADILLHLFSKNNLAPKSLLNNPGEAQRAIVEMAGNDVTLSHLRNHLRPPQARAVPQARVAPAVSAEKFQGLVAEEKVRADLAEVSASELQKQCEELAEDAKMVVSATEGALKAQLAILVPDFDISQIGFFKDIVDGKVIDPSG
ncbi:hypothetical protein PIB30_058718 [Stylosanthes scabra]|uniref:Uncharacterized protein n=1 Tax=Stylosanthes scabra TaxID=79078 RepID=A0ABU6RKD6_9FABA|nr:hypothetical protein [Stylosanthes scabra]